MTIKNITQDILSNISLQSGSSPFIEDYNYYLFSDEFMSGPTSDLIRFILSKNLINDKPKNIKLIINSPGGETSQAFALVDIMKGSRVPIYTYGIGEIASCGLLAFMAGKKGHRYITRNTAILSHQFSWGSLGKEHELFAAVSEYNNVHERILHHYKICTGLTEAKIKKFLLPPEDVWLTAEQAIDFGLADHIVEFP